MGLEFQTYRRPRPGPIRAAQITRAIADAADTRPSSRIGENHGLPHGTLFRAETTGKLYVVTGEFATVGQQVNAGDWLIQAGREGAGGYVKVMTDSEFRYKDFARFEPDSSRGFSR